MGKDISLNQDAKIIQNILTKIAKESPDAKIVVNQIEVGKVVVGDCNEYESPNMVSGASNDMPQMPQVNKGDVLPIYGNNELKDAIIEILEKIPEPKYAHLLQLVFWAVMDESDSEKKAAEYLGVSSSTVGRWLDKLRINEYNRMKLA